MLFFVFPSYEVINVGEHFDVNCEVRLGDVVKKLLLIALMRVVGIGEQQDT